jgi:hypothetical protein
VPAQARLWTILGPQTGVDSPLGQGKLELLSQQIMTAAKRLGISPEQARDKFLRGEAGAGMLAGTAGLGTALGASMGSRAHHNRISAYEATTLNFRAHPTRPSRRVFCWQFLLTGERHGQADQSAADGTDQTVADSETAAGVQDPGHLHAPHLAGAGPQTGRRRSIRSRRRRRSRSRHCRTCRCTSPSMMATGMDTDDRHLMLLKAQAGDPARRATDLDRVHPS